MSDLIKDVEKTLKELFEKALHEAVNRSYTLAGRDERKRRKKWLRLMFQELDKVREHTIYSTALAESDIDDVICGNDRDLAQSAAYWEKAIEHEMHPEMAALWKTWPVLLRGYLQDKGEKAS